jgi:hypothetical protein
VDVINDDDHLERCGGMVGKVRFLLQDQRGAVCSEFVVPRGREVDLKMDF